MDIDDYKQRLSVYEVLKDMLLKADRPRGFCGLLMWRFSDPISLYDLPELLEFRPEETYYGFWFPLDVEGTAKRIICLDAAINKLKQHGRTTNG